MSWELTAQEMMRALLFVLCEKPVKSDALFIHGSQGDELLDEKELEAATKFYLAGLAPVIVLNGLTAHECRRKNLAYIGYEPWLVRLTDLGVERKNILVMPASNHTMAESKTLLDLADKFGWETMTIMAYPYHQLRCFLGTIALFEKSKSCVEVYNQTFNFSRDDWPRDMVRIVLGGKTVFGSGTVAGAMDKHIEAEFERVVKYAQILRPDGPQYSRHATIPEMFGYLKKREELAKARLK